MAQDSLNKITTMLASHLDRELDEPFKRILAMKVDYWRSTLISRSLDKHPQQRAIFRQTLYIPMEQAIPTIGCDTGAPLCKVAMTTFNIPTPMRIGNILFDYVGSIDGYNPFRVATPGTLPSLTAGPYGGLLTYYEFSNTNTITVPQNKFLPYIRIDGVFDKPLDVMEWNCKYKGICDFWNQPYPITGDIMQMVTQYILTVDYQRQNVDDPREIEVNPQIPKNKNEA